VTEILDRRGVIVLFALVAIGGCSKGTADAEGKVRVATTANADTVASGTPDLASGRYTPGPIASPGSVSGTIRLEGAAPGTSYEITKDQAICGTVAPSGVTTTKSGGISSAIVWIAAITAGKPLPLDRREELASEDCSLEPRVQAAVAGTTVDVVNADKLLHRLVFIRMGTHDTLTVTPFFNAGQLVASERIAKHSGMVEVRCAQHPWTRAYLAVFDHPYFAVTSLDGRFKIDSVPPGAYKIMVWHEGMARPLERQVRIAAAGTATLDASITLAPTTAAVAATAMTKH
jgi:hypothetical protein